MFEVRGRNAVLFITFLAIIPVWIPTYFPATDLPQHAAQIGMLRNLHSSNFPSAELFHINWFTPYLLGYALINVLTPLLGMLITFKVVISAALIGLVLMTELLVRSYGGDGRLALLVIPTLYGGVTMWGFLNFLVAIPLGLLFLTYFLRYSRDPTKRSGLLIAVFYIGVFFAHALICVFFGILATVLTCLEKRRLKLALKTTLPLLPAIPVALLWIFHVHLHPRVSAGGFEFHSLRERLSLAITFTFGWEVYRSALLGLLLLLVPLIGYRFRSELRSWIPLIVTTATVLLLPFSAMSTAFLFPRFSILLFPMYATTLTPRQRQGKVNVSLVLLAAIGIFWISWECRQMWRFQKESQGFTEVLNRMEPNAQVLSVPLVRTSPYAYGLPYIHFPAWYSGLKGGTVSPNFARTHVQLVVFKDDVPYEISLPWEWEWGPTPFITSKLVLRYRYVVVESKSDTGYIFQKVRPQPVLRAHSGMWWLYENENSPEPKPMR